MLKNKDDQKIEEMMNQKGYSHAEAMAALKKKSPPAKEAADPEADDSEDKVSSDGEEVCLPANLLPEVSVGKEVSFSLNGKVTKVEGDMVYVETSNLHADVREPMKDKGLVKGIAVEG